MGGAMKTVNPDFKLLVERCFSEAAFVADVGITYLDCGPGWCESRMPITARHLQNTGVVHAGAQTTLADHTAGAAGVSLLAAGDFVLTVEFKLNLLRPASGEYLWCRAQVLKPGKTLIVVESEVYAVNGDSRTLVSKLNATLAVVQQKLPN